MTATSDEYVTVGLYRSVANFEAARAALDRLGVAGGKIFALFPSGPLDAAHAVPHDSEELKRRFGRFNAAVSLGAIVGGAASFFMRRESTGRSVPHFWQHVHGVAHGAAVAASVAALCDYGESVLKERKSRRAVADRGIMLSVQSERADECDRIEEILYGTGAKDVSTARAPGSNT